jgi:AcrR family transcriptional regulator
MGRWEPNTRNRLAQAAMKLYVENGFEQTTVAEIAREAGLTERTFFRHYADKREVLFSGTELLQETLVTAVSEAPGSMPPLDAVAAGLDLIGGFFAERTEYARQRQTVIASHAELRERELLKLAALASAVAAALRGRGVGDPAASLAAQAGMAVFQVAFERWTGGTDGADLRQHIRQSFEELKAVTAGR